MKYLIVVLMLLLSSIGWSQEIKFLFRGKVENIDLGKKEGGVAVTIIQNGRTVASVQTASSGKYTLRGGLDAKSPFEIVFGKAGFVSKRVRFDFSKMNDEDTPASSEFEPVESLDIDLFKVRPGLDFSFLDTEPVAAFDWNADKLKPNLDQGVVSRMRRKIEELLNKAEKEKAEKEAAYQAAIQSGQIFYDKKEYEKALDKYEEAIAIKPNEKLPADRIVELDALIKAQKSAALAEQQADSEYNNLIQAADNLRDKGELQNAVNKYKEAITKKPEQYPKDQVELLTARIAKESKEKENQAKYDAAIKLADGFMKQNSLRAAKDKYTEAKGLKPSEQYPKDKLKEIADKIGELEAREAQKKKYDDAIAAADKFYTSENFQSAKDKYEEALTFERSATYPKERIKMCDLGMKDAQVEAELAKKISDLIKKGNDDLSKNNLLEAKSSFSEVLTLDDQNTIAPPKLAEIERLLEEAKDLAAQDKKYTDLIKAGDIADRGNKLEAALGKYNEAKGIKSTPEVQEKINAIQAKIDAANQLADNKAAYDQLINEAGQKMTANNLEGAKADYEAAGKIDPSQALPPRKIAEIDALLTTQASETLKKDKYDALLIDAQGLLTAGDLDNSKLKYVEAGKLYPTESEPKNKIREIDNLIAQDKERAKRELDYTNAIADADRLFNEAKWEEAQRKYREAMTFDNINPYPGRRLTEIDGKIEVRDNEIARNNQIEKLLKDGKRFVTQRRLPDARDKFQEVLVLDPTNTEAINQIATINTELAEQIDAAEKEAAFKALKEEGFQLASDEKYSEAKQKLQEALALKQDTQVSNKIAEIDRKMQTIAASQELDEKYEGFLTEGEGREASNDLNGAITSYQEASKLKRNERVPKDRIAALRRKLANNVALERVDAEFNKLMNEAESKANAGERAAAISKYQAALNVKPNEQLPKDKIQELRNQLANQGEIDRQYRAALDEGDQFMSGEDYLKAIGSYNDALALKPSEKEPVDKAALAEEAERKRGGADAQYEKLLFTAQEKIDSGDLVKAEEYAKRAKRIKPKDPRPEALMTQITRIRAAQADYDKNMALGESKATSRNYQDAIDYFEIANTAKPIETLPNERIAEMNQLLADQSTASQKEKLYQDNMAKGRATESASRYVESLSHYQNALSVKRGDQPAQDKISEIQQILDDLANANTDELARKNNFDALIKTADELFDDGEYVGGGITTAAKETYERALALYPSNTYALTQRDECVRLASLGATREIEAQYSKLLKVADQKFKELDYDKAKELYSRAVVIKNRDPYPKKKLVEIEAILNPVLVESVELVDPGIPFDASQIDGGFILEQDEQKRILFKKTRLQRKADAAYASEKELTAIKTRDRLETRNEILLALSLIIDDGMDSDDNRLALIEALRIADEERDAMERGNQHFETAENLSTQGTLDLIREDVTLQKQEDDLGHMINTGKVKAIQSAQTREDAALGNQYVAISYEQDAQINQYISAAIADTKSDYDDRLEIERTVDGAVDHAYDVSLNLADGRTKLSRDQQNELDRIREAKRTKHVEDAQMAGDNNDELIVVQQGVARTTNDFNNDNREHGYQTDAEIAEVNRLVLADNTGFDKIRNEANERLKYANADQRDAERIAFNSEMEKYLANQVSINTEIEKKKNIQEQADAAMAVKISNAEYNKERARLAASQGELTDLAARQNVSHSIDLVELNVEQKDILDAQKTMDNADVLADVNKTKVRQNDLDNAEQKEKALANQQAIHGVDNTPQAKPRIKNALGEEYPEGVSQESFKQTDNDGLVKSIITRRVVVIEGHADVYQRTQTLNGITYSKNNRPSLSNVWNSETQGPHLVRHY